MKTEPLSQLVPWSTAPSAATLTLLILTTAMTLAPRTAAAQSDSRVHLRAAVVFDRAKDASLRDSRCDVAPLLSLFGCGTGSDGTQLGARGRFDRGPGGELAVDVRLGHGIRIEGATSHQPGLDFSGNANFLSTGDTQPVVAAVTADTLMARAVVDLGAWLPAPSRVEPFAGAGIGASHNRIGGVVFTFPGLPDQPSTTTARGGRSWQRAWDAGGGVRIRVTRTAALEVGYRYQDLGDLRTAGGPIGVIRGTRDREIAGVAGLTVQLRTHRIYAGIRMGL